MSGSKKPTLDDIAKIAGVSRTAVSMILNEKKDVSFQEDTIRKVQAAADQIGYVKKETLMVKRNLFSEKTILVLTPTVTSTYYATLVQAIEQEAHKNGIRIITQNTFRDGERELSFINQVKHSNLFGIISTMTPVNIPLLEELNKKIPVVVINDRSNDVDLDTVEINNYSAGVLIANHMIELGHKCVAYISTTLNSLNTARVRRLDGILDTYRKNCPDGSVIVKSKDITPVEEMNNINIETAVGYELTSEAMKNRKITGFIAVNDMVAYGVMEALLKNGYRIPEDYSICGFDNLFPSEFQNISLTTVEHHIVSRGQNAVEIIVNRHNSSRNPYSSTRVLYKHELIVRKSTGRPRNS
ncbi:LacI family DNA-binding transcriptional regulator [Proteiniclasticum sp. SCR006]|uniref:LacI family DNA-binding transcriptional regulator n=1 Tax=Proteiniclasticum aestuarii TaxID=2817862 RepID=A0A939HD34_9CLOT|nr:LacI family DNA-binding transcriptional regulator [Proteiniclasticum aestuarii]MBO1266125.1 LacI family DNA-binding transcriptional regulator [Proteiniclasticum aestuarii]